MKRNLAVVAVVIASLLLLQPIATADAAAASTQPASNLSEGYVIGSAHSDFGTGDEANPKTTKNLSIAGSGDSANLTLDSGAAPTTIVDDFEDGDTDVKNSDWSGWTGSGFSAQSTTVINGTYSGELSASSGGSTVDVTRSDEQIKVVEADVRLDNKLNTGSDAAQIKLKSGGSTIFRVLFVHDGTIQANDYSGNQIGTWSVDTNYAATIKDIDYTAETYDVYIDGTQAADDVAFSTSMSSLDEFELTNDADGGTVNFFVDDVATSSESATTVTSGRYVSANHSVEEATHGFANLTLDNATADVSWDYYDGASWVTANSSTISTTGNHTLELPDVASETWRADVQFSNETGETTAKLHDEGVLFDAEAPQTDDATASPSGGETINSASANLSVQVSDRDFAYVQDDSLDATIHLDGQQVHSETVTSNGTLSTNVTDLTGGTHRWNVTLKDEYGHTTTANYTFKSPSGLEVYNELKPSELVQQNGELRVRFYTQDGTEVTERRISDGTVDLTGLPVDERLVVTVRDTDENFTYRRIIIDSLTEQQEIYLLPASATSEEVKFVLDDQTGQFSPPGNVDLFVEKPIRKDFDGDGENETQYQTILGDNFGASGSFPAVLRSEERYRLRARNDDGDVRILGSYTASSSGEELVTIGEISVSGQTKDGTFFGAQVTTVDDEEVLRVEYRDPAKATSALSTEIYEYGNESNVLSPNSTSQGPYGRYVETYVLPENSTGTSWQVRYHADRDNNPDVGGTEQVGTNPEVLPPEGVDERVLELAAYVALVAIAGFLVIVDDRIAALATTVVASALTMVGAVDIPGVALGIAGAISVIYAAGRSSYA